MVGQRRVGLLAALVIVLAACGDSDKTKADGAACTPKTCAAEQKNCGSMPDGCGGVAQCGASCVSPAVCGGGGVANVCGAGTCTPTTCAAEGKTCGRISDGCSDVLACGDCPAGKLCSVANVCVDKPDSGPQPDTGPGADLPASQCKTSCMAQPGAVCCKECGCSAAVKCTPVCPDCHIWDCEMRQCYKLSSCK